MGQVQNQAYGYFFPHGGFFLIGDWLHVAPWVTQRVWWWLLLLAGFWGMIRLAEAIGIGSRGSRIVAAIAFVLCPRVITTLGSISSESLPMLLAPWVLLPVVRELSCPATPRRAAAQSAVAVALMGAVNAVATVAACVPALVWWLAHRPNRAWVRFTAWWIPCALLATCWWLVPLLLLGRVSPPFLDYIESSGVTTQWASLAEVLRGTDSWTPFVSPERIAGAVLVTQPAMVLATGLVAAAGMAGLAMRSMPARGRLTIILGVGLAGLCAGYVGDLGSPFAESVRTFLDSGGAPLRNVHKLEPLIRMPLVLGLAHLLARVPLPASAPMRKVRSAFAHPERDPMVALGALVLVALTLATSLAWTAKLAPRGAYAAVPQYWHDTADWLAANSNGERALVVPGAPFGSQVWGLTRDEPLQALASTPWAVRDAIPLNPPGTIRAMDSVQRLFADGRPSPALAATLRQQGIGFLVLRNDLDPDTSRSTWPLLAHQTIEESPGIAKVAEFGDPVGPDQPDGLVADGDLRPKYPAVQIYRVAGDVPTKPYAVDLDSMPIVQGGPEVLERLNLSGPALLASDAAKAGVPIPAVLATDTPADRETDFGQVDNHSSAIRAPTDPRRTHNLVPDYPVAGAELVRGAWTGAYLTVSSAASDATQLGGVAPGSNPATAVDGDPATSWLSNGLETALGQWLQVNLEQPVSAGLLHITTSPAAIGTPVKRLEVQTPNGSTAVRIDKPGTPVTVALPGGTTPWIKILATATEDGSAGSQFGISELALDDYSNRDAPVPVRIAHRVVLPAAVAPVSGWDLGQELPGRTGCADAPDRVRCSKGLALAPEELGTFERTLSVPAPTTVDPTLTVRSRQGPALETLLTQPDRAIARGAADIGDLRGSAFAATDGDPRTSWTAPEDTVRKTGGAKPTITIELPAPTLVAALRLQPSLGQLPARPTSVSVDLGDGPQVRTLDGDTTIDLHPTVTSRITLSLDTWKGVLDHTAIGFDLVQPPGLAEVTVLGADREPVFAGPFDPNRRVSVDCDRGPVLDVAGRKVRTSVTATVEELRSGAPVQATVCDGPADLPAGAHEVTVDPTPLFTVDRLQLPVRDFHPPADETRARAVVAPYSNNPGWRARYQGAQLRPIVVNGWQQGWLLPDGANPDQVVIDFPDDKPYRLGIFGGLCLLIPLFALAFTRSRRREAPAPRTWRSATVGFVALAGLTTVIAGPVGAVLTAAGLAIRRRHAAIAGIGTALSMAALSRGPWRSPDGYVGHQWWVQLPALVAVIAVGLSVLPEFTPPIRWRRSKSRTRRRTGSSTSA